MNHEWKFIWVFMIVLFSMLIVELLHFMEIYKLWKVFNEIPN